MGKNKHQMTRSLSRLAKRDTAGTSDDPVRVGIDKSIIIDMSKLQTPANVYDADVAWIEHQPGDVRLFFGKLQRDRPTELRSRLEVRYPPENLLGHFWKNSREFHERVRAFVNLWPATSRLAPTPSAMKTEKEHSEWANFESMAHAGTEAVLDFYSLPPTGLAMFNRGQGSQGLRLMPIVRVQMTTFELLRLLEDMTSIVTTIKNYLPEQMEYRLDPIPEATVNTVASGSTI